MMDLDITTSQYLQNNKNGLAENLRHNLPEDFYKIPEYFDMFDPRKPPKQYVEDKLTEILEGIF